MFTPFLIAFLAVSYDFYLIVSKRVLGMESNPPFTVLIIEDEEINRMMLRKILESNQCEVVEASNQKESFEQIGTGKVQAIFVDINLGEENGMEILQKIRDDLKCMVPAFAASATLDESELVMIENTTLDGFIGKPYDRQAIKEILDELKNR